MTPYEFVIWMKGFVAASNHWNLTPKAWDEVKETLMLVSDDKIKNEENENKLRSDGL
jgi:hypothetical protein